MHKKCLRGVFDLSNSNTETLILQQQQRQLDPKETLSDFESRQQSVRALSCLLLFSVKRPSLFCWWQTFSLIALTF